MRKLPCEQIANELERSLDILETPARNIEPRHRTMRAAFEPTWERLTDNERTAFMKLSVFRGGFTREAAEYVARASLRTLSALVDKSLLRVDVTGRYDIHELLRQYAEEQVNVSPPVSEAAHDLHAAYYAEFLHDKWGPLRTHRQRATLDEIEVEIDNVRTTWRYIVGKCNVAGIGKSAGSLWYFHDLLDRNHEAMELFGQAVEALRAAPSAHDRDLVLSHVLARQGWFYSSAAGLPGKGQEVSEESLAMSRRSRNQNNMVIALDSLCMTSLFADDFTKMTEAAREGLQIAKESQGSWWVGRFLFWWGQAAKLQREIPEARQLGEECLEIAEECGDLWLIGCVSSVVLGEVAYTLGDYSEAQRLYQRSRRVFEELGMPWGIGGSNLQLGKVSLALNKIADARNHFRQSLIFYTEIGQRWETINVLTHIANLQVTQGKKEWAVELLALISRHPATSRLTREQTEQWLTELESDLPSDVYMSAYQRGEALKLDTVIAELLGHGEVSQARQNMKEILTESLTERELEVLHLIAQGLMNRQIAERLFLSLGTVKWYTSQIFSKLHAQNRTQAIVRARELNLLV